MLSADPGRLADEVTSFPLFGERRIVRVQDADSHFAKAVTPLLENPVGGNFILAEAGGLNKSNPLRTLFESSAASLSLALPDANEESAVALINGIFHSFDVAISSEAQQRLIELAGQSSALLRQESEKLALYCHGSGSVALGDVEAICMVSGESDIDELLFSCFGGDVELADFKFVQLSRSGVDAGRIVGSAHRHALRLVDLKQVVDRGANPQQAVRAAKPPVIFKHHENYVSQLRTWRLEPLLAAAASLGAGVCDTRRNPACGEAIASRALLATARKARLLRSERL
jgi:DNA polymerase-3 subunit delta